jgi:hypothetical protein
MKIINHMIPIISIILLDNIEWLMDEHMCYANDLTSQKSTI